MTNHLLDEVGLAPLAGDLERVEVRLRDAVSADDRFLGEAAGHLLKAGGKRLRPDAGPLRGVRGPRRGRARLRRRRHRRRRGRARARRLALPRRRDRRGRDPPGRAERERPLVEHRRDPRRRLPARPGLGARRVARRRRRRAARRDDRRAVPGPGARAAVPLRRRPNRRLVPLGDRGQDRVAHGDRVPRRRHGQQRLGRHARRAHPVRHAPRHVLPGGRRRARRHAHRSRARQARRQRRARGCVHTARDLRVAVADASELKTLLGRKLDQDRGRHGWSRSSANPK